MGELNLDSITPKALGGLVMAVCPYCFDLLRSFCAHSSTRSMDFSSAKLLVSYGAAEEKTCIAHYQLSEFKFESGLLVPQGNPDLLKKRCDSPQSVAVLYVGEVASVKCEGVSKNSEEASTHRMAFVPYGFD
jgi:hypothetical protein